MFAKHEEVAKDETAPTEALNEAERMQRPVFWFVIACVLTTLAYLPGLYGPFLFDDISNLEPLGTWLAGNAGWQQTLLGNESGTFGRPLSMLSFMLDAHLFGMSPFSYKVTNLILHIGCGALVFLLCRAMFVRDVRVRDKASWWALALATIWLLHPMQTSTVLYVVQRMAQLSAGFVLIALLCYLRGRTLLESSTSILLANSTRNTTPPQCKSTHQQRAALLWLFLAFPLATMAAALSKENGVLAPLFALVLEFAYFNDEHRPRSIRLFFALFLFIPGALLAGWGALHAEQLFIGYETRDFTLEQRLLTQPRVLFDYVSALLLPRGAAMGLYGDDFSISTGLTTPISTLLSIGFWIFAAAAAWLLRRRSATLFAGVFVFLTGHLMESSALPLEIYFEHRNYLPSLGVFLSVAGLLDLGYSSLRTHANLMRVPAGATVALVLVLGLATHMRAWTWQTWSVMVTQAAATHPHSIRAQFDLAALYIKSSQFDRAYEVFTQLRDSPVNNARNVSKINSVVLDCQLTGAASPEHLAAMRTVAGNRLGSYEITAVRRLINQLDARECKGLSNEATAMLLSDIANRAPQSQSTSPVWMLHHFAADFYAREGQLMLARNEAQASWTASANASIGLLLFRLLVTTQEYAKAELLFADLQPRIRSYDQQGQRALAAINEELIAAKHAAISAP